MSLTHGIDISTVGVVEFTPTTVYIAEPVIVVNGECVEIDPVLPESATGVYLAEPVITINGACKEIAHQPLAYAGDRYVVHSEQIFYPAGVPIYVGARASLPGDTGKELWYGAFADFDYNINGYIVSFTDTSRGEISSWLWNFGDGNYSTVQNPSNTYPVTGAPTYYTVILMVTYKTGQHDIRIRNILVDSLMNTINDIEHNNGALHFASSHGLRNGYFAHRLDSNLLVRKDLGLIEPVSGIENLGL